jgi:hypothetical protein
MFAEDGGSSRYGSEVTQAPMLVMAGLDPAIHPL